MSLNAFHPEPCVDCGQPVDAMSAFASTRYEMAGSRGHEYPIRVGPVCPTCAAKAEREGLPRTERWTHGKRPRARRS